MCWNPIVGRRNLYLISIIGADCSGRTDALNLEFPQQGFLHQVFLCPVFLFKTSKMYSKLDQVYCAWLIISVVKRDKVNFNNQIFNTAGALVVVRVYGVRPEYQSAILNHVNSVNSVCSVQCGATSISDGIFFAIVLRITKNQDFFGQLMFGNKCFFCDCSAYHKQLGRIVLK